MADVETVEYSVFTDMDAPITAVSLPNPNLEVDPDGPEGPLTSLQVDNTVYDFERLA